MSSPVYQMVLVSPRGTGIAAIRPPSLATRPRKETTAMEARCVRKLEAEWEKAGETVLATRGQSISRLPDNNEAPATPSIVAEVPRSPVQGHGPLSSLQLRCFVRPTRGGLRTFGPCKHIAALRLRETTVKLRWTSRRFYST